jgi:hypothetical protein
MKITSKTLKNANITIVADKLHTSFLSQSLFSDILPNPQNLIQIPPFGLIDFGNCNFIVDVDNRRIVINHNAGNVLDSPVPKMAKKFVAEVKGPDIVAVGFNFSMDLTCDSEFGKYSTDEFLTEKYKAKFSDGLSGIGIKAFIKKIPYNCTFFIEPHLQDAMHALASANFHFEIPYDINFENEFSMRYNEFEEYVNGIFS